MILDQIKTNPTFFEDLEITCPITLDVLNDPVLLPCGTSIEKNAAAKLKVCPMTRTKIQGDQLPDDSITGSLCVLADCCQLLCYPFVSIDGMQKTTAMRDALKGEPSFLTDPIEWCRLLAVVIDPGQCFIRRHGGQFVLEGRREVKEEDRGKDENPVFKKVFSVNGDGLIQHYDRDKQKYKTFPNLDAFVQFISKKEDFPYRLLEGAEKTNLESIMNKNDIVKFLMNPQTDKDRKDKRILEVIIRQLEKRYSDVVAKQLVDKHHKYVCRPRISPLLDKPTFTLIKNQSKHRLAYINGELLELNSKNGIVNYLPFELNAEDLYDPAQEQPTSHDKKTPHDQYI
jgi:hypothetical protein